MIGGSDSGSDRVLRRVALSISTPCITSAHSGLVVAESLESARKKRHRPLGAERVFCNCEITSKWKKLAPCIGVGGLIATLCVWTGVIGKIDKLLRDT